ncbi:MAG: hypothetical protein VXW83_08520, partial [SAR324 cluster bacterium]|nr:hypothetical protein [SAR324 cluster bacterium]
NRVTQCGNSDSESYCGILFEADNSAIVSVAEEEEEKGGGLKRKKRKKKIRSEVEEREQLGRRREEIIRNEVEERKHLGRGAKRKNPKRS